MRCALIERAAIGGTCVNIGCVPSKTLLAAAHRRHAATTNSFPSAPTWAGGVDLSAPVAHKDELVAELRQAKYLDLADSYGFDIIHTQRTSPTRTPSCSATAAASGHPPIWWPPAPSRLSPISPA